MTIKGAVNFVGVCSMVCDALRMATTPTYVRLRWCLQHGLRCVAIRMRVCTHSHPHACTQIHTHTHADNSAHERTHTRTRARTRTHTFSSRSGDVCKCGRIVVMFLVRVCNVFVLFLMTHFLIPTFFHGLPNSMQEEMFGIS